MVLPEASTLNRRVSVGTLLVPPSDLKSPDKDPAAKPSSLRRRITDLLNGPPPADEEVENWVD
jgi:hypothetical protein